MIAQKIDRGWTEVELRMTEKEEGMSMVIGRTHDGQRIYRGWNKDRQSMDRGITENTWTDEGQRRDI